MAQITHAVDRTTGAQTSSSGTYVNPGSVGSYEILGSELDGTSDYILIVRMAIGGSSSSANDFEFEIYENGVGQLVGSHSRIEPRRANTQHNMNYTYIRRVTTAASPNDYEIRFKSAGVNTVHVYDTEMIMIKLDDLAASDWAYANDSVDNTFTGGVWEDGASITIGDGTSSWAIFTTGQWAIDNVTDDCRGRLNVGGTTVAEYLLEGEDTIEEMVYGTFHAESALAASTVVKNEFTNSVGSQDILDNSIFALRLDAFEDFALTRNATSVDFTGATPIQPITLTHTAVTGNDPETWMAFGMVIVEVNGSSAPRTRSSLRDAANVDFVGNDGGNPNIVQHGTTDYVPVLRMWEISEVDGVDIDWDMSVADAGATSTPDAFEQALFGFTWELSPAVVTPFLPFHGELTNTLLRM